MPALLILTSPIAGAALIIAAIIMHDHWLRPWKSPLVRVPVDTDNKHRIA